MSTNFNESGHRGITGPTMQTCYACHNYFRTRLVDGHTRMVEWDEFMYTYVYEGITPPKWMIRSVNRSKKNPKNYVVHDCVGE